MVFATDTEVLDHVGEFGNATYEATAYIARYLAEAESLINATVRYNFSDNYASLNDDVKKILTLAAAAKTAMMIINADTTAYPTTSYVTLKLNVLDSLYEDCIKELKEKETQRFINGA